MEKKETIANSCYEEDLPEWLNQNLFREFLENDFTNVHQVTKFLVEPAVKNGENYMTKMLRVEIEVEMNDLTKTSTSYMIKIQPAPEKLREYIKKTNVFLKEGTVYKTYIPAFEEYYKNAGLNIKLAPLLLEPKKTKIDDDFIILEDLRPKGFKNVDRHLGMDLLHTKSVLLKLAQFHAASAHYFNEHGPYPTIYQHSLILGMDGHRMKINNIFIEHLNVYGDYKYLEGKLKTYAENQSKINSDVDPNGFNVLNHGDCWTNNIMFQYDQDGELKETFLIDLQMCRYGSPAQDLLYFLISSTNLEVKIKHFDYFIYYYHQQLTKHLKLLEYKGKLPKLKDIHTDLLKYDFWAYKTISVVMPITLWETRDDANAGNLANDQNDDLRRTMYCNSLYVKNMNILLPWLDNRGTFEA